MLYFCRKTLGRKKAGSLDHGIMCVCSTQILVNPPHFLVDSHKVFQIVSFIKPISITYNYRTRHSLLLDGVKSSLKILCTATHCYRNEWCGLQCCLQQGICLCSWNVQYNHHISINYKFNAPLHKQQAMGIIILCHGHWIWSYITLVLRYAPTESH